MPTLRHSLSQSLRRLSASIGNAANEVSPLSHTSPARSPPGCIGKNISDPDRRPSESDSVSVITHEASGRSSHSRSAKTIKQNDPKYEALKKAFEMIDADSNGRIDADELLALMNFRGVDMTPLEAMAVIRMYSSMDNAEIGFEEFVTVMQDFEGAEVIDLNRAFVRSAVTSLSKYKMMSSPHSSRTVKLFSATDSMNPNITLQHKSPRNARLACAQVVDGPKVHLIVFVLIIFDVVCVIGELLLHATWCDNPNSSHRRLENARRSQPIPAFMDWRSGREKGRDLAGATASTSCPTAWCTDCADKQHDWEVVLHKISISILFVFAAQITVTMVAYGRDFFKNGFFILDAVIVGGALILELALNVKQGALLVILLLWRLGRIIHGLVTTVEIGHKRMHARINDVLRAQLHKKAEGMKELKERFSDLKMAKDDLEKLQTLLKPTGLTIESIDEVPVETLRQRCKLQIVNNHDVLETLANLEQDLAQLEQHIQSHVEDATLEALRLGEHRKSQLDSNEAASSHVLRSASASQHPGESSSQLMEDQTEDVLRRHTVPSMLTAPSMLS